MKGHLIVLFNMFILFITLLFENFMHIYSITIAMTPFTPPMSFISSDNYIQIFLLEKLRKKHILLFNKNGIEREIL